MGRKNAKNMPLEPHISSPHNVFNKNINSVSDYYIFLNSTKLYLEIISDSSNKESALARFPKYLFAEKDVFLKILKYQIIQMNFRLIS